MSESIKVLFLIEELCGGGKQRRLTELLKGLNGCHANIEIHLILNKNSIDYPEILKLPITLHRLEGYSNLGLLKQYFSLFTELKPDVVHTWSYKSSFYVTILKPFFNYRFISGFISDTFGLSKIKGVVAKTLIYNQSDVIVSNSMAGLNAYKVPDIKGKLIYNGFDPVRISLSKNNTLKSIGVKTDYTVVMLANVTPYKNYQLFIDIAEKITAKRTDITFISIGRVFPEFEFLAAPYIDNKNPYIKFLGFRDDTAELIKDCDLGLLCTYTEGISNAILELMANGVPVITNDIEGGSKELINHKVDGIICDKEKMQEETLRLLKNKKERNQMAIKAKEKILQEFSLQDMVANYEKVYSLQCTKIEK